MQFLKNMFIRKSENVDPKGLLQLKLKSFKRHILRRI